MADALDEVKPSHVPSGYAIGRDARNTTERERQVLGLLAIGTAPSEMARVLGLSKQRIDQLLKSLLAKGIVEKNGDRMVIVLAKKAG